LARKSFPEGVSEFHNKYWQKLESFEYLKDTEAERVNENETHV
jgi:hypothetical protein